MFARVTDSKQLAILRRLSVPRVSMMNQLKISKRILTISVLAMLAACAGPAEITLSDGTLAYQIDCEGTAAGLNYCLERAGKSCGAAGYTIIDPQGRTVSRSDAVGSDMEALVTAYRTDRNSIYVRCGS